MKVSPVSNQIFDGGSNAAIVDQVNGTGNLKDKAVQRSPKRSLQTTIQPSLLRLAKRPLVREAGADRSIRMILRFQSLVEPQRLLRPLPQAFPYLEMTIRSGLDSRVSGW